VVNHFLLKSKLLLISRLSEKYYLPHLHIKEVLEEVRALKNELG
jgi:hypothetical protein